MTTVGHITKAMRDIDDEDGKNDWVRAILKAAPTGGQGNRSAAPLHLHSGRSLTGSPGPSGH
jgi:hypothetical protein